MNKPIVSAFTYKIDARVEYRFNVSICKQADFVAFWYKLIVSNNSLTAWLLSKI